MALFKKIAPNKKTERVGVKGARLPEGDSSRETEGVLILKSRGGKRYEIMDPSDREFLEWADDFILEARDVQRDPSRRSSRL